MTDRKMTVQPVHASALLTFRHCRANICQFIRTPCMCMYVCT